MPNSFVPPNAAEYLRFAPEALLVVVAALFMVLEPLSKPDGKRRFAALSLVALVAAMFLAVAAGMNPGPAFSNLLVVDSFSTFFTVLVLAVGVFTVLISSNYLELEGHESGEYYSLVLFSIVGQCVMVASNDLIMLFIGLECSSISSYVLSGYLRDDRRNNESALKYFLLGSFATAFFLYGIAWVYGMTGSTNLSEIRTFLMDPAKHADPMILGTATALMFVGLAFKISAAPFQIWAPDVYEGAPAPVTAFMMVGPKAASFAMLMRILMTAFEPLKARWEPILWICAVATMVIGNTAALRQSNLKRLLAYSAIANAGYMLVALTAHSEIGNAAVMFYLAAYALMSLGAFSVIIYVARKGERFVEVSDLAGLSQRQPMVAVMLSIFMLSYTGIPATAGFFGKFYIFKAALDSHLYWLAVLGMLVTPIAAFYYLRLIVVMYMHPPAPGAEPLPALSMGLRVTMVATAAITIFLGLFPSFVLDWAGRSAALIR
jgi:NADH-quinone oxidoreductase subunit N